MPGPSDCGDLNFSNIPGIPHWVSRRVASNITGKMNLPSSMALLKLGTTWYHFWVWDHVSPSYNLDVKHMICFADKFFEGWDAQVSSFCVDAIVLEPYLSQSISLSMLLSFSWGQWHFRPFQSFIHSKYSVLEEDAECHVHLQAFLNVVFSQPHQQNTC